jgi:phage-related protein
MSTVDIQSQRLTTTESVQLFEFDFSNVGGSKVYIASGTEWKPGFGKLDTTWDGSVKTFEYIELEMSGVRSDLTGALAEPSLKVSCAKLWEFSSWSSSATGLNLSDYQGVRVRRQRLFYSLDNDTPFFPQTYYIKSVDEFNAYYISFTLTSTLGGDRLDLPSARKLEL